MKHNCACSLTVVQVHHECVHGSLIVGAHKRAVSVWLEVVSHLIAGEANDAVDADGLPSAWMNDKRMRVGVRSKREADREKEERRGGQTQNERECRLV